ncbi:MAG: type I-E CRISPR-associated protein Cse2/CasB [Rhizobiaceae bacterium]|nr:type I-E CRISPR-associated protein Cse2/CasB [Rhizobiaceae bacterium]
MGEKQHNLAGLAMQIAAEIGSAGTGEKAETRRMGQEGSRLYWRLIARLQIEQKHEEKWLWFMRMIALLTPASQDGSIHKPGRPLGAVLADGGEPQKPLKPNELFVSETRLARLLATRGSQRLEALERTIRMIARKRPELDVATLAQAVFRQNDRTLRDYFDRLDKNKSKDQTND